MKTVVLLSGGVDSSTALALMINQGEDIFALTVDYGQRHRREIKAATDVANYYRIKHLVARVDPLLFSGSALTVGREVPDCHANEPDATYVPARNTVLLALAAARAESIGATKIVIGANADDEAGYPDCRRKYVEAFRDVLQLGTLKHVWLMAPLIGMTKADVLREAAKLEVPLSLTWSCYRGGSEPCGRCGACEMLGAVQT